MAEKKGGARIFVGSIVVLVLAYGTVSEVKKEEKEQGL